MARLKKLLAEEFEIKDLGKLRYFLGIEVSRSGKKIFISQRKYIMDLLKETGMMGSLPRNWYDGFRLLRIINCRQG